MFETLYTSGHVVDTGKMAFLESLCPLNLYFREDDKGVILHVELKRTNFITF